MSWYLTLVQQIHDKPRSRRTWVLVQAPDAASARAEGADVVSCRWPQCRGMGAILLSLAVSVRCKFWLNEVWEGRRVYRPLVRQPPYTSELSFAYDALFSRGKHRHVEQDARMKAQWTGSKAPVVVRDAVRDEEEI